MTYYFSLRKNAPRNHQRYMILYHYCNQLLLLYHYCNHSHQGKGKMKKYDRKESTLKSFEDLVKYCEEPKLAFL